MGNNITESTNIISGQTASFYQTPSKMNLKHFWVDFTPTQSGTGDPSPSNIRPINSYASIDTWHSKKNLAHVIGYSAKTATSPTSTRYLTNTYGTTLSTIDFNLPDTPLVITQSNYDDSVTYISHYNNGYFAVVLDNLPFNKYFDISFKVSDITNNLGNAQLSDIRLANPYGTGYLPTVIGDRVVYRNIQYKQNTSVPLEQLFFIYICGMSFTMSEFMVTEVDEDATVFEPWKGMKYTENLHWNVYGGRVDLITHHLTDAWYEYALTGDETYTTSGTGNWVVTSVPKNGNYSPVAAQPFRGFCTHYPYKPYTRGAIGVMYNERTITFDATIRSASEWKQFCKDEYDAGHPVTLVYVLKDPFEIDDSEGVQVNIQTFLGKNYFWSKNDSVEVEYYLHDGNKMSDFRRQISMNEPHLATATGNAVDFGTDMVAPIESCKINFLPKQEGSGDPSPSNVRAINGWSKVDEYKSGKNMVHVVGFSATSTSSPTSSRSITNRYGTTIDTTTCDTSNTAVTILQANYNNTLAPSHYRNGYFVVVVDNMVFDSRYNISFRITNITSNPGNIALSDIKIANPWGSTFSPTKVVGDKVFFNNVLYRRSSNNYSEQDWCVYCSGMSFALSEFMVTPVEDENVDFEPYHGEIIPLTIPPIGKNLYNANEYPLTNNYWVHGGDGSMSGNSSEFSATRDFIPFSGYDGQKITLNKRPGGANPGIAFYSEANGTSFISGERNNGSGVGTPLTTTVPDGTKYMRFTVPSNAEDIQIELGEISTEYEPYKPIYGGYVDIIKGELVQEYGVKIFTGREGYIWNQYSTHVLYNGSDILENPMQDGTAFIYGYCSHAPTLSNNNISSAYIDKPNPTNNGIEFRNVLTNWGISEFSSEALNTFLKDQYDAGTPVTLIYKLAVPIVYTLTPHQLQSFRNTNRIWSDANDDVEVTYWKHEDAAITRVPGDGYTTSDDYLIALSDGYILGEEANYVEY